MDRFDNIWKERLNQPEAPVHDWSTPSDQVWAGISKGIATKDNDRAFYWRYIGIGLLASVVILGAYFFMSGKIQSSANDFKSISTEVADSSPTSNGNSKKEATTLLSENEDSQSKREIVEASAADPKKIKNGSSNTIIENDSEAKEAKKSLIETAAQGPSITNIESITQGNTPAENVKRQEILAESGLIVQNDIQSFEEDAFTSDTKTATQTIDQSFDRNALLSIDGITGAELAASNSLDGNVSENRISIKENNEKSLGSIILSIPPYGASIDIAQSIYPSLLPLVKNVGQENIGSNWIYGIEAGLFYLKHDISSAFTDALTPFDFSYVDNSGLFTRMTMARELGNFIELGMGLEYSYVEINSGHNSAMTYSLADETNGQSNSYELDLATPYGLMKSQFDFERNQMLSDSNVSLLVDFRNIHEIHNLRAPLFVRIAPLNKRRPFQAKLTMGAAVNRILDLKNQAQSINTNHDAIRLAGEPVMNDQDIKLWHFDVFGGADFSYDFNPGISIGLNYEYSMGRTRVFELNDFNTRLNRHYIGIGLSKDL